MTREMRRRAVVAGLLLFGALLLGAQPGLAAPAPPTDATAEVNQPKPLGPTDIAPPTFVNPPTTTSTPTQPPTTTTIATTTTTATTTATTATTKPAKPPRATKPTPSTTPTTTTPPATAPTGSPTPNPIDAGHGGVPGPPTALFWAVPGLAVLTLASGVSGYWLARSEQDRR